MTDEIDIAVIAEIWAQAPGAGQIILRAIEACGSRLGRTGEEAEISIVLCDDAEIRRLNRQWRGKDAATNVLSFPTPPGPGSNRHLGDIVIAFETVEREAREEAKRFDHHLSHMAVHGYLHLTGFDHENENDAEEMEQLEREILASIGIADPYHAEMSNSPEQNAGRQTQ